MTINQILDKILSLKNISEKINKIKTELVNLKQKYGGNTKIENCKQVENIIKHGNKEGVDETKLS